MLDARLIKSADEIMLLNQAAAMVDGVYQDIVEALKPGIRENEIVALANKRLYEMGSDQVEAINAVSRRAVQPAPAQLLRPADPAGRPGVLRHHPLLQRLPDLLLPHVRASAARPPSQRDAYTQGARVDGRGDRPRSSPASAPTRSPPCGRGPTEFGFANEMAAFGLQFGHGLGLGLHERPIISRLNCMKEPIELQAGMVFALETYCPATDGFSAARIEEEVVVTDDGPRILTLFPAQDLVVANPY